MFCPLKTLIPAVVLFPILWGKVSFSLEKVGYNDACKVTSRKVMVQDPTIVDQEVAVGVYEIGGLDGFRSIQSREGLYSQEFRPYLRETDKKEHKKTDYNAEYFHYKYRKPAQSSGTGRDLRDREADMEKSIDSRAQGAKRFLWGLSSRLWKGNIDEAKGTLARAKRSMGIINTFQGDSSMDETTNMSPISTSTNETPIDSTTVDDKSTPIDLSSTGDSTTIADISTTEGPYTATEATTAEVNPTLTIGTSDSVDQDNSEVSSSGTLLTTYEHFNDESKSTVASTSTEALPISETTSFVETESADMSSVRASSITDSSDSTTPQPIFTTLYTSTSTSEDALIPDEISISSEAPATSSLRMSSGPGDINPIASSSTVTAEPTIGSTSESTEDKISSEQSSIGISNRELENTTFLSYSTMTNEATIITFTMLPSSDNTEGPLDEEINVTETILNTSATDEVSENSLSSVGSSLITTPTDSNQDITTSIDSLDSTISSITSLFPFSVSTTSAMTDTTDLGQSSDVAMTSNTITTTILETTFVPFTTTANYPEVISSQTSISMQSEMITSISPLSPSTAAATLPEASNTKDSIASTFTSSTTTVTVVPELNPTEKSSSGDNQFCDDSLWLVCDTNTQHCKCKPGMTYDSERNICVSLQGKDCQFGGTEIKLCVKNAECSTKVIDQQGICKCSEGFLPAGDGNGNCLPGLGMPCKSSSDINTTNPCHPDLKCSSEKCICQDGLIEGRPGSHRCYLDINANCTVEKQECSSFAFLNCSENTKTCKCEDTQNQVYDMDIRACVAVSGRTCMIKDNIEGRVLKCVKNSHCNTTANSSTEEVSGTCECVSGFDNDWRGNCFMKNLARSVNPYQGSIFLILVTCVIVTLMNMQY